MALKEDLFEVKKLLGSNWDSEEKKFKFLQILLRNIGITIFPRNINIEKLNEGIHQIIKGIENDPSYFFEIKNLNSYKLTCEFIISKNSEEIIYPVVLTHNNPNIDLTKKAYNNLLYILFGIDMDREQR